MGPTNPFSPLRGKPLSSPCFTGKILPNLRMRSFMDPALWRGLTIQYLVLKDPLLYLNPLSEVKLSYFCLWWKTIQQPQLHTGFHYQTPSLKGALSLKWGEMKTLLASSPLITPTQPLTPGRPPIPLGPTVLVFSFTCV